VQDAHSQASAINKYESQTETWARRYRLPRIENMGCSFGACLGGGGWLASTDHSAFDSAPAPEEKQSAS
jgi:iron only hydrogenase large subunit-like protein